VASPEDAEPYAVTNDTYYRLAEKFMPGPLTVILPKKDSIPYSVTGGLDSVAVRCPAHPVARALIREAGAPVAAPSANRSGRPSPTCASHVVEDLDGRVAAIIDGGECEVGLESTIVKLNGDKGILLRPGAITADALSCVCETEIAAAVTAALTENERPLSPGMKYRHYAPQAPLVLLDGSCQAVGDFLKKQALDPTVGILCYDEHLPFLSGENVYSYGKKEDDLAHSHLLFDCLRRFDETEAPAIYAVIGKTEGIGLALYNRMLKASAYTVIYI
jgi:L-threonylcarbamoyladenylate synthase